MRRARLFALLFVITACTCRPSWDGSIDVLLESVSGRFGRVLDDPELHRLQIIYTRIERDSENHPTFHSYRFRSDSEEYFYPASTVKLPVTALALEKLHEVDCNGLTRDSAMLTESAEPHHVTVHFDATSPTGYPTVAHYVRKILLVSDNEAFNRLYEFVGHEDINETLRGRGYGDTRIVHRLGALMTEEQNRSTNPVRFLGQDGADCEYPAQFSARDYGASTPVLLGDAEVIAGKRIAGAKDFATKNAYPLQDLHDTVLAIMFPDAVDPARRFDLSEDDYRFVWRAMSEYPSESGVEAYSEYPDGYVKFLMYGGDEETIPDNIRIFNKVGDAYGFLTDAAYVVDFDNDVEFVLAATIYVNANQTFNDDHYEYDTIGLPFLRELGLAVYELELERERAHQPDLSALRTLR